MCNVFTSSMLKMADVMPLTNVHIFQICRSNLLRTSRFTIGMFCLRYGVANSAAVDIVQCKAGQVNYL
jgi:hypothetical protein